MAAVSPGGSRTAELEPLWLPASQVPEGLTALDDRELLAIVRSLPAASEERAAACEALVVRYRGLVRACVRRYSRSPELADDLMQEGYVGLVKAINNFDPAVGLSLASYAYPCVSGEIKRHFRDKRWQIHVKRSVKDLVVQVRETTGQLAQELGREPAESDLAGYLGVTGGQLRDARRAEIAFLPSSLDAPLPGHVGTAIVADLLGEEDPRLEHMLCMQTVAAHWGELPAREQTILLLRFQGDLTQADIGRRLGISQMQVSRLLAHALCYLRPRLLGLPEDPVSHRNGRL